jgi:hypothetical protein
MKEIIYILNGKSSTKKDIAKRKSKKVKTYITEKRYYEAPLTEEERKVKETEAYNTSRAFQRIREDRADLEARHG